MLVNTTPTSSNTIVGKVMPTHKARDVGLELDMANSLRPKDLLKIARALYIVARIHSATRSLV